MAEPKVFQKAPIVQEVKAGKYWWCSCGLSDSQPFCSGAHKGTDFAPVEIEITEDKKVAWCACKHTGNKPFCDGKHKTL
jgi:CDGSH iron-sulfur domain-containing protein 3